MEQVKSVEAAESVLGKPEAVVFKHSPRCAISRQAYAEMTRFCEAHPDVPVHLINVIEDKPISNLVAERTSVKHESPQLLVLRDGRVVWHASHHQITLERVASAAAPGPAGKE